MGNKKGSDGLHHGEKERPKRDRDGQSWDPTGGAGIGKGECHGYSGGESVSTPSEGKGSKQNNY